MSKQHHPLPLIAFAAAITDDFDALLAIRIEAMRENLERIGRFDLTRERFKSLLFGERIQDGGAV